MQSQVKEKTIKTMMQDLIHRREEDAQRKHVKHTRDQNDDEEKGETRCAARKSSVEQADGLDLDGFELEFKHAYVLGPIRIEEKVASTYYCTCINQQTQAVGRLEAEFEVKGAKVTVLEQDICGQAHSVN